MPFGAANAPSEFMRLMANLLVELIDDGYCIVFIDDILIYSGTNEDHERHVKSALDTSRKARFCLHSSKCSLGRKSTACLAFEINDEDPEGASGQMLHLWD